ncbi:transmembrane protein 18-domain-containing protein [Phycomyces nitens]|nr:transmembrane protein 18-domain-containing protein [Phycomyces nitens]
MSQDIVQGILQQVQQELERATNKSLYAEFGEYTLQFFKSVDWSQSWLKVLVGFHVLCMVMPILLRNRHTLLSIYFFAILGLAALTSPLNSLGAEHWQKFASANYFDPSGMFIVIVYAFPLLINGFFTLFFILRAAIQTMVLVKRQSLKATKSQ